MIRTVSDKYLREQTVRPSTRGWYDLIVKKLESKRSSRPFIVNGEKRWNADAVAKLLKTSPEDW